MSKVNNFQNESRIRDYKNIPVTNEFHAHNKEQDSFFVDQLKPSDIVKVSSAVLIFWLVVVLLFL